MRISDWSSDVCSSDLRASRARPWPRRNVGDAILLGQIVGFAQAAIENVEQPDRLVAIAFDGIVLPLGRVADEMMRLSLHRAETGHLPHQPLLRLTADRKSTRLNSSH